MGQETFTQPWGFPFSNMRPHTFTPPKRLKLTRGELPGCSTGVLDRVKGDGNMSFFCLHISPLKEIILLKNPFTLPETSYNEVPESIYLFIQQTRTEHLLLVEFYARHWTQSSMHKQR